MNPIHPSSETPAEIARRIQHYLHQLCVKLPHRHVGSPENRAATDFFTEIIAGFGFDVKTPSFDCIDWEFGPVYLQADSERFEAQVSPYSLPCDVTAPLVASSTVEQLQNRTVTGKVLLLHGDLVREQLMPKGFPFYNPEHHRQLYRLLEEKAPAAIVAATGKNPELAGAWYPFPLFEDGDFDIPSVFMKDVEGQRLATHVGADAVLNFQSRRIPATGCNVIATKGADPSTRLVFCAHIDSKKSTPGALDNGTGVATLLALAGLLAEYNSEPTVEIVAINGEDYYAASGEIQYVQMNAKDFDSIRLAVNMDVAGYRHSRTAYSLYGCPPALAEPLHNLWGQQYGFVEGEEWYASDHSLFIQNGCPAAAITSENFMELSTEVTHTAKDTVELADAEKLADIAYSLRDIVQSLANQAERLAVGS